MNMKYIFGLAEASSRTNEDKKSRKRNAVLAAGVAATVAAGCQGETPTVAEAVEDYQAAIGSVTDEGCRIELNKDHINVGNVTEALDGEIDGFSARVCEEAITPAVMDRIEHSADEYIEARLAKSDRNSAGGAAAGALLAGGAIAAGAAVHRSTRE